MGIEPQDDRTLAQLYKKAAKENPSPELDRKILGYAASKHLPVQGNSHFGTGWKVPFSLAASVVLIFTILVQLDQSPKPLDLPIIPAAKKMDILSAPKDKNKAPSKEVFGIDENVTEFTTGDKEAASDVPATKTLRKSEPREKLSHTLVQPDSIQEKTAVPGDSKVDGMLEIQRAPQEIKATNMLAPTTPATVKLLQHKQETSKDEGSEVQPSTMRGDLRVVGNEFTSQDAMPAQELNDVPPLLAKDWLLKIELLVAKKKYGEAIRQLEKFKQAYPKVNVVDLESKIP